MIFMQLVRTESSVNNKFLYWEFLHLTKLHTNVHSQNNLVSVSEVAKLPIATELSIAVNFHHILKILYEILFVK
jgi:hypothetical protein